MKKDIKKIVEWLCCYCTRGALESIAESNGYKNPRRIDRAKLEQIAYISCVLCDVVETHYQIRDSVTNEILVNRCGEKYMIDYVLRECWFNWFDESEKPLHKKSHHELRIDALRS